MRRTFAGYSLWTWVLIVLAAAFGATSGWLLGQLPPGDYYPEMIFRISR